MSQYMLIEASLFNIIENCIEEINNIYIYIYTELDSFIKNNNINNNNFTQLLDMYNTRHHIYGIINIIYTQYYNETIVSHLVQYVRYLKKMFNNLECNNNNNNNINNTNTKSITF